MKRLVYFAGALAMIGFAVLLQLDVTSLYRLVVSGVNDAPIGMYVLWLFPTLLNIDYAVLGDNTFWILLISDVLLNNDGSDILRELSLRARARAAIWTDVAVKLDEEAAK